MKNCKYIITKVKDGGSKITVPSFNLLTTEDFKDIMSDDYLKTENITITDIQKEELANFLNNFIPFKATKQLLDESNIINIPNIIEKVNNYLLQNVGPSNLYSTLNRMFSKSINSEQEIDKYIKALSDAPDKVLGKLYSTINPEFNSLGNISINSEISDIHQLIDDYTTQGLPTEYLEKLNTFLKLSSIYFKWENSENIIKISGDRLKEGIWNLENSLVYSDTPNKEYLFMGLFKRLSSEISNTQFNDIFGNWNEILKDPKYKEYQIETLNPNEFFIGKANKDSMSFPEFDKVLELAKLTPVPTRIKMLIDSTLNKLLENISLNLGVKLNLSTSEQVEFKDMLTELVGRTNPQTLDSSKLSKILENEKVTILNLDKINKDLLANSLAELAELSKTNEVTNSNSLGKKFQKEVIINPRETTKTYYNKKKELVQRELTNIKYISDPYKYLMSNLVIGKDIIKMPAYNTNKEKVDITGQKLTQGKWAYYIVNAIYSRPEGYKVYGQRLHPDGSVSNQNHTFTNTDEISIRKYDDFSETEESLLRQGITPELSEVGKNAISVILPRGITYGLAKNTLSVGDYMGSERILGIYPGYIDWYNESTGTISSKGYDYELNSNINDIKKIVQSKKLFKYFQENDQFIIGSDSGKNREIRDRESLYYLSDGDYFKTTNDSPWRKIIYSDKDFVWTFSKKSVENKVTKEVTEYNNLVPYSRAEIISGIISNPMDLNESKEIINLSEESLKSVGTTSRMSTFYNPTIAKVGDLVVFSEGDTFLYGKVIDKENEIALVWKNDESGKGTWEKLSYIRDGVKFLSKDNRITSISIPTMVSNLFNIEVLPNNNVPEGYTKMKYVVNQSLPKDFIASKMQTIIDGTKFTNIGSYVAENFVGSKLDYTDSLLKKFIKNYKDYGFYVKTTNNIYEKNYKNAGLTKLNWFNKIDPDFMRENMFKKGMYISTRGDSSLYQIETVQDDTIFARRYFRNEVGDMLMYEKKYNTSDLLNKIDSSGNISNDIITGFYIQNGNKNFEQIITEANKTLSKENDLKESEKEITTRSLYKLKQHLSDFFDQINIPIIETNDLSEFITGQKAKLTTKEDGSAQLILKQDLGTRDDLVHETMHLFLGALRFTSTEAYNMLLDSVEQSANFIGSMLDREEKFLTSISKLINVLDDSAFNPYVKPEEFIKALKTVGVNINSDLLPELENVDLLTILKTPIIKFLDLEDTTQGDALYNSNLAQVTPAFMRWLENKQINLKCI